MRTAILIALFLLAGCGYESQNCILTANVVTENVYRCCRVSRDAESTCALLGNAAPNK